jgi:hypothetical protein
MPILAAESNSNAANIPGMLKPWPDSAIPQVRPETGGCGAGQRSKSGTITITGVMTVSGKRIFQSFRGAR